MSQASKTPPAASPLPGAEDAAAKPSTVTGDESSLFDLGGEKSGIQLIHTERQRQINEKLWTADHDDETHGSGDLAVAAVCYARHSVEQIRGREPASTAPAGWPWHQDHWKPSVDPVRNFEKAGALIAAEIDRLLRAKVGQ